MSAQMSKMGKATAVVLSVALLFGMGPDAYGFHHCVHSHGHGTAHSSGASIGGSTCTVDCPGCLHAPPHLAGAEGVSPDSGPRSLVDLSSFGHGPLGPRRGLFESYLPNAPPAA